MNRINDEQALLIVGSCCSYLTEKFVYEHGLFHGTPPTQTVVRNLAQRMVQTSMACVREESDAHIVIGVMMYALKNMRFSLLHEVTDQVRTFKEYLIIFLPFVTLLYPPTCTFLLIHTNHESLFRSTSHTRIYSLLLLSILMN